MYYYRMRCIAAGISPPPVLYVALGPLLLYMCYAQVIQDEKTRNSRVQGKQKAIIVTE